MILSTNRDNDEFLCRLEPTPTVNYTLQWETTAFDGKNATRASSFKHNYGASFVVDVVATLVLQSSSIPVRGCVVSKEAGSHVVVDSDNSESLLAEKSHSFGADQSGRSAYYGDVHHSVPVSCSSMI